ncbi:hypothetical protein NI389_00730 [Pseudoalteromonas xiamenensis]|uniref:hypothetical protein n=1 Tax=Pseudoalteromonas xiamenensis TaxID=882626 RepID=UPI0027E576E2|nr:hypothetical protein [Pseudoalteromonas xiamenensis]WMN59989.1 hypothetical protein NI389_00730 [Pseudoalteromonas xiamenensis]
MKRFTKLVIIGFALASLSSKVMAAVSCPVSQDWLVNPSMPTEVKKVMVIHQRFVISTSFLLKLMYI